MARILVSLLLIGCLARQAEGVERLQKLEVASKYLSARTVRIYLPPSYSQSTNRRYPVLYLHDGQNLFSSAGTNICFGWGNWELDKTVDELCRANRMSETILVAIDNSSARYGEYCGRHHSSDTPSRTEFENYTAFLIQELKPKIDAEYRTQAGPGDTGIMGSSLGGLCSIILAWEHPDVFGRAASLSGSFQVEGTNFLKTVVRSYHQKPKPIRMYLDSGIVDYTGGDDGRQLNEEVASEFRRIGWGGELLHFVDDKPLKPEELDKTGLRRDKWSEAQTSQHNEFYWRLRVWRALTFLCPAAGK